MFSGFFNFVGKVLGTAPQSQSDTTSTLTPESPKPDIRELRAKLRVLLAKHVGEAKQIRAQIQASSGQKKYVLWNDKRRHGEDTRTLYVIQAWARGRPLLTVEGPNTRVKFTGELANIAGYHFPEFDHLVYDEEKGISAWVNKAYG